MRILIEIKIFGINLFLFESLSLTFCQGGMGHLAVNYKDHKILWTRSAILNLNSKSYLNLDLQTKGVQSFSRIIWIYKRGNII